MVIFGYFFQNGSHPPSWICYWHVWSAHKGYLLVFITAKCGWNEHSNLDNMQVLIFNAFGLKMPIHAPNGGFGGFTP